MFLVTIMFGNWKICRKVFSSLSEARTFCDVCASQNLIILGVENVDTALSDLFGLSLNT